MSRHQVVQRAAAVTTWRDPAFADEWQITVRVASDFDVFHRGYKRYIDNVVVGGRMGLSERF